MDQARYHRKNTGEWNINEYFMNVRLTIAFDGDILVDDLGTARKRAFIGQGYESEFHGKAAITKIFNLHIRPEHQSSQTERIDAHFRRHDQVRFRAGHFPAIGVEYDLETSY